MHTRDPHGGNGDWASSRGGMGPSDDPFGDVVRRDMAGGAAGGRAAPHAKPEPREWTSPDAGFIGLVSDEPPMIAANAPSPRAQAPRQAPQQPQQAYEPPAARQAPLLQDDPFQPAPPQPLLSDLGGAREADQPIPRIKIHAACDRRDVARAVQVSAGDRRMAKAQISIEMGGVDAAIARLTNEPSPDLLILDTAFHGVEMLRALERLAEVVEPKCKVMIIGGSNDIALYRRLMQVGVSEYLVAPLDPLHLIRSIGALYADPDKPFAGRVAAFLGARGGVGSSTVAHNVAWSISEQQGSNVTLVDLDLPFGTAALDFNQEPPQSILEALAAAEKVDEMFLDRVVSRPTERLMLFSAPARLEKALDMDANAVATVLDKVRRTGPNVVLDLPHTWTSWMNQTVLSADDLVIVATPDLSSLRNTKNLVEFAVRSRPNDAPPMIVLNMVGMPKRPEISAKDFADHVGAPVVAEIPFDPAGFGAAANNGEMLMELNTASKAAPLITALASRLTGRTIQAPKRAGLLDKIGLNRR
jgi:pilus assembly protein CpaE